MKIKLREYREAKGLTQKQLAKTVGKAYGTIQSWERGDSYPNAAAVCDLCDLFGTDPNTFLDWYADHPQDAPQARPSPAGAYRDPAQDCLNGYYESMNTEGRAALVESARLMSGSPETRIEKDSPGYVPMEAV